MTENSIQQSKAANQSDTPLSWRTLPRPLLLQLGLFACVIAVFWPVCRFDFLNFDDNVNVYKNYHITDFSYANLLYFWTRLHENLYIPLTYTLWGAIAKLSALIPTDDGVSALHPSLFHAMNLTLHGGSALVLFQILRRWHKHDWAAALGALLFAIHPVQVETVAWVTGMKDALCGFCSMLALWQYLAYAATKTSGQPWRSRAYLLATLFLALALLSKPGAVTVPLLVAVLVSCQSPRPLRQLAIELGPWFLMVLPVVMVTKLAQPAAHRTYLPALWQRFLIAGDAITFYLEKLLLPLTLGPDYGRTPQVVLSQGWVYATGLIPYLLALLLAWRYRKPCVLAMAGVFVVPLLPVLGFIPFDFQDFSTVADRYLYMAMLGPALSLAWLASRHPSRLLFSIVVGVLVLLAGKSAMQVQVWQNSLTFNTHMVKVNPQSSAGYINLGVNLKEANRIQEAIASFQKSIDLDPKSPHAYVNLGQLYEEISMFADAERYYKKALEVDPYYANTYSNLGDLARKNGNIEEALSYYKLALGVQADSAKDYANLGLTYKDMNQTAEAIAAYQQAIAIEPDFAEVYSNLGLLYETEDQRKAITMYQKALSLKPSLGEAANNLGYLYLGMQRAKEAIPLFKRAIAAYPNKPLPHNNLGLAYVNLGQLSEAAACFQKALAVDPSFAPALNNLSKVELQRSNVQAALDYADQAKALGFDDPEHFQALQNLRK